ncbi:MAG: hypothetical protein K9N55_03435 [Phycisphaerae bacterium]|nr:hypothetical protein [Phycisphaerae bacterium]
MKRNCKQGQVGMLTCHGIDNMTKQELEAMVNAIDAEDGNADGMFTGNIV